MMIFRGVRDKLIELLGDNQGTDWITLGYRPRDQAAQDLAAKPIVQVSVQALEFAPTSSAIPGPVREQINFSILLSLAAGAKDGSPIEPSAQVADQKIDILIDKIWSVLMDARNQDLGSDKYTVTNRFVSRAEKSEPENEGELTALTATITMMAEVTEDTPGADSDLAYQDTPYSGTARVNIDDENQAGAEQAGQEES